jgi:hypothetical protein
VEAPKQQVGRWHLSAFALFELSGLALLVLVAVIAAVAFWIRRNPATASSFFRRIFGVISPRVGEGAYHRVHSFGEGLNTIKNFKSFLQVSGLSIAIWLVIGFAYVSVTHAYRRLAHLSLASVLLLTAGSVMGGILQLPVVGGGSQLATIAILKQILLPDRPGMAELATSCGIMLWLITFMSVIPAGLVLAHFERVSLLKLEEESQQEEVKALEEG